MKENVHVYIRMLQYYFSDIIPFHNNPEITTHMTQNSSETTSNNLETWIINMSLKNSTNKVVDVLQIA